MRGFFKILTICIYSLLVLFIQSNGALAYENLAANTSQQYISKPETTLINNKKEEYYIISRNDSGSEITNPSNNNNFGFSGFDKINTNYNIDANYEGDIAISPIYISNNVPFRLKNAIYTRAP